jgi:hypothetical protein
MDDFFKNELIEKINCILNLKNPHWEKLNKNIKLKYIHHACSYLQDENKEKLKTLTIPLKSIKPKKLIQYCKINNVSNSNLYFQFNKLILDYTFNFRNKYVNINKRIYWSWESLPANEYNEILSEYNKIVYTFMKTNSIDINELIKMCTNNNYNKLLIVNLIPEYKITYLNNTINLSVGNLSIIFTLKYSSKKITNNIPVKYQVQIINNI